MKTFIHIKGHTYICVLYILYSCSLYAQGNELNAAQQKELKNLKTTSDVSIRDIKPKIINSDNRDAYLSMQDYNSASKKLYRELEKPKAYEVMDNEYMDALGMASDRLYVLSQDSNANSKEYADILNAITKDYNTKIKAMDASIENSFAKIKVKVRAKKEGAPVIGYSVSGDCIFNAFAPIHQYKSNNLTDDAELLLPVGTFMIYLVKDNIILQQREIDIDYDVHDDIIFQL